MTAPTCLSLTSPTKCWLGRIGGDDDVACAGIAVPTAAMVASSATRRYELTILIRSRLPVAVVVGHVFEVVDGVGRSDETGPGSEEHAGAAWAFEPQQASPHAIHA